MVLRSPDEWLLCPSADSRTRILFLARHAPDKPLFLPKSFPGDGGYPAYYHRVQATLRELGYQVTTASHPLAPLATAHEVDLIFSLFNRMPFANPEIFLSSLSSYLRVPMVGAAANVRALAEDKWYSKLVARSAGLPVAQGAIYDSAAELSRPPDFAGPYFIKNRFGAASEGIDESSIQGDWAGARKVAARLLERGMKVLVEEYAPGIDITVPVLGGPVVLGVVQPHSNQAGGIITENLKRDDPLGYGLVELGPVEAELSKDACTLWRAVGPMDYFRLDYRFDPKTGRRIFLEFNICCHIGRSGAITLAATKQGLSHKDVLGHVIEFCLKRHGQRAGANF